MVLIDAAKGCATQPPDLSKYKADFVVMSFYKVIHLNLDSERLLCTMLNIYSQSMYIFFLLVQLFGYPTGLGALIVRNGKQLLEFHTPVWCTWQHVTGVPRNVKL